MMVQACEWALQLEEETKGGMRLQLGPGGSVPVLPWEGSRQERQ